MDVELFLEGRLDERWTALLPCDAPGDVSACLRARAEGGRMHGLPGLPTGPAKVGPKVDVPAIQLVGPETSKKEIESLYYEVYKL